jgi:uncharacterized membrane protein (UPF0127 family)
MLKKIVFSILIGFSLLFLTSFIVSQEEKYESEDLNANEINITINGIELLVDIADEPHEQEKGLSGRDKMAENKGMLFIFPDSSSPSFWMKEMEFSLDIIWIDNNDIIVGITKNISPDTYPQTFSPPSPIKYVLEVNAGWSDRHNIKIGDKMK